MTNPTVGSIRHHLVVDNGWDDVEVDVLLANRDEYVNEDGTTKASHDQWERFARDEPESN